MLRRLSFLLPDEVRAEAVVDELHRSNIANRSIRALANQQHTLENMPKASWATRHNWGGRIESILWHGNLWLFFISLVLLVAALVSGDYGAAVILSLLMLLSFVAGEQFVEKLPTTHLDNFTSAIQHGAVLLMVDVPFYRVNEIVDKVHRHYPEAQLGGTCWSIHVPGI